MALSKGQVLACFNPYKRNKNTKTGTLEEKPLLAQFLEGRRASLLTQREDLKTLTATCSSWNAMLHDLPSIPKRNDRCWILCSVLVSEVQGLRIELLKLQRDVAALDLQENEIGILEEVVRVVHRQLAGLPELDRILADRSLLARSKIRLWHCPRVRKHALAFEGAAQRFQNARERVQSSWASLAVDRGQDLDWKHQDFNECLRIQQQPPRVIRLVRVKINHGKMERPPLLLRISKGFSNGSCSALVAAHPPQAVL